VAAGGPATPSPPLDRGEGMCGGAGEAAAWTTWRQASAPAAFFFFLQFYSMAIANRIGLCMDEN
jgi:hypothetical protein